MVNFATTKQELRFHKPSRGYVVLPEGTGVPVIPRELAQPIVAASYDAKDSALAYSIIEVEDGWQAVVERRILDMPAGSASERRKKQTKFRSRKRPVPPVR